MTTTIDPQNSDLDSALDQLDIARFSRALAEAERARIASRKRRVRGVVVAIVATALAGAGLVVTQVQHQGNEARDGRIAEISASTLADEAFIREASEAAGRVRLAAILEEQAARRTAANDAISASVAGGQERLLNSEGKVLDNAGRDALAAAITEATTVRDAEGGSIWTVEGQPGLIVAAQAVVDADVVAFEAEQARIAEEARIAAEAEAARVAAEKAAAEATRRAAESAKSAAAPAPRAQKAVDTPAPTQGAVQQSPRASVVETEAARWGYSTVHGLPPARAGNPGAANGWYWEATPNTIYVRPGHEHRAGLARHEVAHGIIHQTCGTSNPAIAAGRHENVTEAYAQIFMGGGSTGNGGRYSVTDGDRSAARSINAGTCS